MLFVCYEKCGTCRKAQKYLDAAGASYERREIDRERPTEAELREWQKKSGRPFSKMFNTSGKRYRELGLSRKLKEMSDEEMLALLSSDGMLVKRPVLVCGERVLFGFREEEWEEVL